MSGRNSTREVFRRGERVRFSSLANPWSGWTGTVRVESRPGDRRVYVEWDCQPGDPSWQSFTCLMLEAEWQRDKDKPVGDWPRYRAGLMGG